MSAQICETCKNKGKNCYCAPNSTCLDYEELNTKHTIFGKFKSINIDEMVELLDKYGMFDNSPWISWFDEKYCKNCESIMCHYEDSTHEFPCAWCELNDNCKFLPNAKGMPSNKEIIKMWLESEVKE